MKINSVLTENGEFDIGSYALQSITEIQADEWEEAYSEIKKRAFYFLPSGVTVELRRRIDGAHGNFGVTPGIAWYYEPGMIGDLFDSGWVRFENLDFRLGYFVMARLIVP